MPQARRVPLQTRWASVRSCMACRSPAAAEQEDAEDTEEEEEQAAD